MTVQSFPTETATQPPIHSLSGEFVDPATERRYRDTLVSDYRKRAAIAFWIGAAAYLAVGINDWRQFGATEPFFALASIRLATLLIPSAFLLLTRLDRRPGTLWLAILAGDLCFAAAFCAITALLSDRVAINAVLVVSLVLAVQLFVPNRAVLSALAGMLTSIAFVVTLLLWTEATARDIISITIMLTMLNTVGAVTIVRLHHLHRRSFALIEAERGNNERLKTQQLALRALAKTLAQARDEADHANRAKSEFLAHMSHELRAPLNAINGFSEIIRDGVFGPVTPARYSDYAADIHRSGMHLLALINDILDLSKIEAGRLAIEETSCAPAAAIEASLRLVRDRAHSAGVKLRTQLPAALPLLRADERMLKQMLINLLTNAVKFTPEGGEVTVAIRATPEGGMAFAVSDTGIGIEAADIPRVLEPYGQVAAARGRNPEGTGLGLPLVVKMMALHDGGLVLESTPGRGTTATLVFPAERVLPVEEPEVPRLSYSRAS